MNNSNYTHKSVYHTVENSQPVKNIKLCYSKEQADHITTMNVFHGFIPAYTEDNTLVDEGMYHIGEVSPQVHKGHYIEKK